jgi:MFS family permease
MSEDAEAGARGACADGVGAVPVRASAPLSALVALLGAMFLGNVDIAVANIAGPVISSSLHASGGELELIVSGYPLAYAVLLVTSARLGEARGYRPMFLTGLAGFTAASLACGLAPSATFLALARVAAGGLAALMAAQVLTGIQLGFTGRAHARALGLYALVLSAGAVAGQSLGGLLISADVLGASWRPVFLVNVPACLVLYWLAWRWLPSGQRRPGPLDLRGVAALSAALLLLVVPLVFGRDAGWPEWMLACLAASVPALAVLWVVERRIRAAGGRPLVDPEFIAQPAIGWGLAAQAAATATYFGMLFTAALYLQQGLGKSAAYSGLALVPWVAAFGLPGPALSRFPVRVRALAAPAGALILAASFGGIATSLAAGDTSGTLLMTLLGAGGLGLGAMFTGLLSHLASSAPADLAASISGLFNTTTRAGGVLGTAAFGTAYFTLVHGRSEAVHGFALLNFTLAATALAAAALAGLAIRPRATI